MERLVKCSDGRVLRVEEAGDPHGKPVVTLHGTPGAGILYAPHVSDAASRGIRLIGYDRPGYGGSTAQPGRTVADCAADVRQIAGLLGIKRFAVWGVSGGGHHALACAALLPDVVVAVGTLAAPAPYGAPGLDHFAGMGEENVADYKLMIADESAARAKAIDDRVRFLSLSRGDMVKAFPTLLSPVDAAAFTPDMAEYLWSAGQFGLASSDQGWWDDAKAHMQPWGFALEATRVPVQLWHGRHDRFVPFQHGEWLAGKIPGVEAHLTEEDGHVTLFQNRVGQVHAWLLEHF
jgi:pimeloyl-ACP methyl ester carboxylesterase